MFILEFFPSVICQPILGEDSTGGCPEPGRGSLLLQVIIAPGAHEADEIRFKEIFRREIKHENPPG